MKRCAVIDAPSSLGLSSDGVRGLPGALRDAGLLHAITHVRSDGSLDVPPWRPGRDAHSGVLNTDAIRSFTLELAGRVTRAFDDDCFVLVLGGDCSILLGPALALRRRGRYGLVFIDGHADFYSPESEPNGEVASMDLAIVTGRPPLALAHIDAERPLFREQDVVLLGFRDAEIAMQHGSPDVRATGAHAFDLEAVRRTGAAATAQRALAILERSGVGGVWIHLDADVLADDVMPAVDYRMPDGLRPEELSDALATLLASPLVAGMDVTIYNPALDDDERTAAHVLARAINAALLRVS